MIANAGLEDITHQAACGVRYNELLVPLRTCQYLILLDNPIQDSNDIFLHHFAGTDIVSSYWIYRHATELISYADFAILISTPKHIIYTYYVHDTEYQVPVKSRSLL